jgi:proline iminopeptidase
MIERPEWHSRGATVSFNHGPIYFEVEGDGPPTVLVGGGPGNDHTHYHPWFSRLASTHTVVYYDHPGTGRSRPVATQDAYSIGSYSDAIEALRKQLGFDAITIIGTSFGGLPAVDYALRFPDRISALVLSNAQVNEAGWQEGNIDNVNRALRTHFPEAWTKIESLRAKGVRSLDGTYQDLLGQVLPRLEWAEPWTHVELTRSDIPFALEVHEAFCGSDPEWIVGGSLSGHDPPLEEIAAKTLVITGRFDALTTPAISKANADRIPHSEFTVLERSAHRPWAEESPEYFEVLGSWLLS